VWFVSLKLQKRKKKLGCPQCGELCSSVTSSDINIALAFKLVKLLMHSLQHNTRVYHSTVPLHFFVCVTLFQNELFHRTPSLWFSWQYRQRNKNWKYTVGFFFLLVDKTAIKFTAGSINQQNRIKYSVLIFQYDVWGCSGEHISLKSGIIGDSRNLRSAIAYILFPYLAYFMLYRENADSRRQVDGNCTSFLMVWSYATHCIRIISSENVIQKNVDCPNHRR
jgi:hypothetical protein